MSLRRRSVAAVVRGEAGSVSLLIVGCALGLLLAVALLVDASRKSAATSQAVALAEEAARAGGQAVNAAALATGAHADVDPHRAVIDAQTYLAAAGVSGNVTVQGTRLVVTVTIVKPTIFLSMVGIQQISATGTGAAELVSTR